MTTPTRGDTMFQVSTVPRPSMIRPVSCTSDVELGHVLADGAAVVEPQPGIDRDPASQPEGVAHERGGGDEPASRIGGLLQRALRQHAISVDRALAGRKDGDRAMLAPVDLRAHSPLVIRAEPPGPIVAEGGLDRRANLLHLADLLGAAAPDVFGLVDAVRDRRIARGRRRVLREAEPSRADVPDGIGSRRCASDDRN